MLFLDAINGGLVSRWIKQHMASLASSPPRIAELPMNIGQSPLFRELQTITPFTVDLTAQSRCFSEPSDEPLRITSREPV
jgi:hypothetical protein